jgi:hypothetical protein
MPVASYVPILVKLLGALAVPVALSAASPPTVAVTWAGVAVGLEPV